MKPRLINVRLDPDYLRKVRVLRENGVALSSLVREAIDEQYAVLTRSAGQRDAVSIVTQLFERYPDPPTQTSRAYDVHDAQEAREAVRKKLTRKRRTAS